MIERVIIAVLLLTSIVAAQEGGNINQLILNRIDNNIDKSFADLNNRLDNVPTKEDLNNITKTNAEFREQMTQEMEEFKKAQNDSFMQAISILVFLSIALLITVTFIEYYVGRKRYINLRDLRRA